MLHKQIKTSKSHYTFKNKKKNYILINSCTTCSMGVMKEKHSHNKTLGKKKSCNNKDHFPDCINKKKKSEKSCPAIKNCPTKKILFRFRHAITFINSLLQLLSKLSLNLSGTHKTTLSHVQRPKCLCCKLQKKKIIYYFRFFFFFVISV